MRVLLLIVIRATSRTRRNLARKDRRLCANKNRANLLEKIFSFIFAKKNYFGTEIDGYKVTN